MTERLTMNTINKKSLAWTIVLVSAFQMGMVALSPVIAAIASAFPGISDVTAQMAATFLNLILTITALFSDPISKKIGRRAMCVIGMALYVIVGVCGWLLSKSIVLIYIWSGLLGVGTGLFVPAVTSMMVDYYPDEERQSLVGLQTAGVNFGGMILSYGAGLLAGRAWNRAYLMFLLALPVMCMAFKFIPVEKNNSEKETDVQLEQAKPQAKLPGVVLLTVVKTLFFAINYFTFSTNVSLMLTEKGFADTSVSGIAMALFMCGGAVSGFLFKYIYRFGKQKTDALAFLILVVSFTGIFFFRSLLPIYIAAFIGGASLSVIFPFYIVSVGNQLSPEISVLATSLILSVSPNLGSFISPMIITNLSKLVTGSGSVSCRFLTAAIFAAIWALVLIITNKKTIDRKE